MLLRLCEILPRDGVVDVVLLPEDTEVDEEGDQAQLHGKHLDGRRRGAFLAEIKRSLVEVSNM